MVSSLYGSNNPTKPTDHPMVQSMFLPLIQTHMKTDVCALPATKFDPTSTVSICLESWDSKSSFPGYDARPSGQHCCRGRKVWRNRMLRVPSLCSGVTAGSFGVTAGIFLFFFASDIPKVRKDVMQVWSIPPHLAALYLAWWLYDTSLGHWTDLWIS